MKPATYIIYLFENRVWNDNYKHATTVMFFMHSMMLKQFGNNCSRLVLRGHVIFIQRCEDGVNRY
jgi:SRSO17 transposase